MTDQEREELLAKRAVIQADLDFIREFNRNDRRVRAIEEKYNRTWYITTEAAVESAIGEIDKQLDYDSYLIGLAKGQYERSMTTDDVAEIFRRYLADRGVVVEKPE